jgi:hypothetical protein
LPILHQPYSPANPAATAPKSSFCCAPAFPSASVSSAVAATLQAAVRLCNKLQLTTVAKVATGKEATGRKESGAAKATTSTAKFKFAGC